MTPSPQKVVAATIRACEWLAAIGIFVCVGLNLAQVVFRYFLYAPLPWSEEVMRYSMIWVAMMGAAAALGRAELPAVNLFAGSGNAGLKRILGVLSALSVSAFCVTLIFAGWPTLRRALRAVSPAAEIPLSIPYLAVFIGCALMALIALALVFLKEPIGGDGTDD